MNTTEQNKLRPDLEPLTDRLRGLRIDDKGYPVPWFVGWIDGKPEFRAADVRKLRLAIRERRCWVCGEPHGVRMTFVIGPMCGINRVSAEPPSHLDCAEWSVRNCPFLSNAGRTRREDENINNENLAANCAGMAIARNPGVILLWNTRNYFPFDDGNGGTLLRIGEAEAVTFWKNGRTATRAEIDESVATGIPTLHDAAKSQGLEAVAALAGCISRFTALLERNVR